MWVAALALTAGALWLIYDAAVLRDELPQLRTRLERLSSDKVAPVTVRLPPERELNETRERVAKINAAAQTKGLPTLALLGELEQQLPAEAWLTAFHHRAAEGEVVLVAAAASAEPLSVFLHRLEGDPLFEEAMLLREVQPVGSGPNMHAARVQYEIRLKVRP
jgi:hypothetical protein